MHVHGSCHCGAVRYEAEIDPERTTICHCTDCQALTGSAYRVSVPAHEGSFRLVAGEPAIYLKVGDSGAKRALGFCSACGSPLFATAADAPKVYNLRVGGIAERAALVPRRQKWWRSALHWTEDLAPIDKRETE